MGCLLAELARPLLTGAVTVHGMLLFCSQLVCSQTARGVASLSCSIGQTLEASGEVSRTRPLLRTLHRHQGAPAAFFLTRALLWNLMATFSDSRHALLPGAPQCLRLQEAASVTALVPSPGEGLSVHSGRRLVLCGLRGPGCSHSPDRMPSSLVVSPTCHALSPLEPCLV